MVKSKPATVTKAVLKKYIDSKIIFWTKQAKLHISKREDCLQLVRIVSIIDILQQMRKQFVGSKKKL